MKLSQKLASAVGAGVLIGATCVLAAPAHADTTNADLAQAFSAVPVSTGTALYTGTATDGSSPAAGAIIALYGIPTTTSASPTPGSPVALAWTTAGSDGSWSLTPPAGDDLTPYTDGSSVNFQITQYDTTGIDSYDVSATASHMAQPVGSTGGSSTSLDASDTPSIALDSGASPATTSTDGASPDDNPTQENCSNSNQTLYSNTPVQAARTYSEGSGVSVKFTYTSGASSSLGGGVSSTGAAGSFTANGSVSKSTNATQAFPSVSGAVNDAFITYWTYQKYKQTCVLRSQGKATTYVLWNLVPDYWDAGDHLSSMSNIATGDCVPEEPGSGFEADSTKATAFSGGVDLSPLGVSFNSDTGFSTKAELDFSFSTGHPLCGLHAKPGQGTYGVLQVHSTVIS